MFLLVLVGLFLIYPTVNAAGLVPCGRTGQAPCTTCDIFQLASNVINFVLFTVVPAIAVLFYLIAGFMILLSRGNSDLIATGKNYFWNTTMGLFIIFGAWMITNTVIKSLAGDSDVSSNWYKIECAVTETGVVIPLPSVSPSVSGACSLAPLAPITDPEALAMENGAKVVWTSSDANIQRNLTKLQQEFNKLQNLMASRVGGSATVNSAYRPFAYQKHFFDIFQASRQYSADPSFYDSNSACSSVISALKAEQQKHGVCSGSGPCLVASPSKCAPHVKGTGVDISISPESFLITINTFLQGKNIDLKWQALASDPVHFNLVNPPFTGCAP